MMVEPGDCNDKTGNLSIRGFLFAMFATLSELSIDGRRIAHDTCDAKSKAH